MNKHLIFQHQGEILCEIENDGLLRDFHIPRRGDYFEYIKTDRERNENIFHYRINSVCWSLEQDWSLLATTVRQSLNIFVNLRRLHHAAEWGNQFEPTGYRYEKPLFPSNK